MPPEVRELVRVTRYLDGCFGVRMSKEYRTRVLRAISAVEKLIAESEPQKSSG